MLDKREARISTYHTPRCSQVRRARVQSIMIHDIIHPPLGLSSTPRCAFFFASPHPDRSNPQGGNSGGKGGGKDTGSGGGPAKEGSQKGGKTGRGGDGKDGAPGKTAPSGGGKGSENDDEGWSRGDSSVSPLIPPFMRKLFMALPRHIGPQPDAEGLLKVLRESALPAKPRYALHGVFVPCGFRFEKGVELFCLLFGGVHLMP